MTGGGRVSTITATFKLSTPAFIAGANNKDHADLRLPSVLGVLRFWWRALAWSATAGEGEEQARLNKLREWEGELFGAAASADGKGGQGRFVARLLEHPVETRQSRPPENYIGGYARSSFLNGHLWKQNGFGLVYLQGLGLTERVNQRNQDTRVSLPAGTTFGLELRSRDDLSWRPDEGKAPSIIDALEVMGLMGGIGARSRRGFGSLSLIGLEGASVEIPMDRKTYVRRLKYILDSRLKNDLAPAPFSAFSAQTRTIAVTTQYGEGAINLHNEMGQRLARYRGYGFTRNGRRTVGGEAAHDRPIFNPDHTWMKAVIARRDQDTVPPALEGQVPSRAIFGFPHNYTESGTRHQIDVFPCATRRRGSPLFLHIHELPNGKPVAVWTLFESRFMPDDMLGEISVERYRKAGFGRTSCGEPWSVTMTPDFEPIRDFLSQTEKHIGGDWSVIVEGSA